jgi:hypothetical protein
VPSPPAWPCRRYRGCRIGIGRAGRLPADLAALAEVAHGLIVHEHMVGMYGFELAAERRTSVHIRPVSRLLDQMVAEDGRPLDVAQEPSARVLV